MQHLYCSSRFPTDHEWETLAGQSPFPTPSRTLTRLVEQSGLVSHLEKMIEEGDEADRFIALGQLWLLFTIYLDTSSDVSDERGQLGVQLKKYNHSHPGSKSVRHAQIGDELALLWESRWISGLTQGPGGWSARLMECVHQSRNSPAPESVYDQLRGYFVPQDLRGLSSFTSWRPQPISTDTADRHSMSSTHAATHNDNAGSDDPLEPGIGRAVMADETDDTGKGEHTCPGDRQGTNCEGSWAEDLAYGAADVREATEGGGYPTTVTGLEAGDKDSRTGYQMIELGDVGSSADGKPHHSIDMPASNTASK